MSESPSVNASATLEIVARWVKRVVDLGAGLVWVGYVVGAYSVYQLWTLDRTSEWFSSSVSEAITFGWFCIAFIAFFRAAHFAVAWAVLMPLEAKITGVNLRDPLVAAEVRSASTFALVMEVISIVVLVAVPLLIARFRYGL